MDREITVAMAAPRAITLAVDVQAPPARVFEILSTTLGLRAFWTGDCAVGSTRARFGFTETPLQLEADIELEPERLVRMRVTSGFPFWEGSTWEWELAPADGQLLGDGPDPESTAVLFRHYGFAHGYAEVDCAHTAQTWAMILERLAGYVATGESQPLYPAPAPAGDLEWAADRPTAFESFVKAAQDPRDRTSSTRHDPPDVTGASPT